MCTDVANEEYEDIRKTHESTFSKEETTPSEKKNNVMQDSINILRDQLPNHLLSERILKEELTVDIVQLSPGEDIRLNNENEDQATECSSSFGDSQEEDGVEVESELRKGNGATALAEDGPLKKRKKRALNTEWKAYRQGIEWRCRWLELRIKQLEVASSKYDRILALAKQRKEKYFDQQGDSSTRTRMIVKENQTTTLILPRKRRRKAEEDLDLRSHMAKHPVFSRYEKKKQWNQGASVDEANKDENQQILEIDEFNGDFEDDLRDNFSLEEDSMEQYLWRVETMQMHVAKLRNHLTIGYRNAVNVQCSPGTVANLSMSCSPRALNAKVSPKAHGSTSIVRRKNSDFDMNNVIMPDNVMANYVEPARHAFIETPHWRPFESTPVSDGGSSFEDTDDDVYESRHLKMQTKEQEQREAPTSKNKGTSSGKRNCKSHFSGKERPMCPTIIEDIIEDFPDLPSTFAFIPRRKRRKRESRDIASITKNIEPLIHNPCRDILDEQTETRKNGNHHA